MNTKVATLLTFLPKVGIGLFALALRMLVLGSLLGTLLFGAVKTYGYLDRGLSTLLTNQKGWGVYYWGF